MHILICDDQPGVVEALRLLLKGAGHQTEGFHSPAELTARITSQHQAGADLVFIDMNYARDTTSGVEGLDLLERLLHARPQLQVIVMTAWTSVDLAVEAMQKGAVDFLQKPWDNARVLNLIQKHSARRTGLNELEIARGVQQRLLPEGSNRWGVEYDGLCVPAHQIGGDYYDFLELDNGCAGFVVADVSGKGIPAALLMANLQASFRSQRSSDPKQILSRVNSLFYRSSPPSHFATAFLGVYDPASRRLRYANCGHLPGLILRNHGGEVETLDSTATVLGLLDDLEVEEGELDMARGDMMVLYTDGITEAGIDNERSEEFGEQALKDLLTRTRRQPIAELLQGVTRAAEGHAGGVHSDDMTLLGVRVL